MHFLSKKDHVIKSLEGLYVVSCYRNFTEIDLDHIPEDLRDQEADGDIYLLLSNGQIIGFHANSELFTIQISEPNKDCLPSELHDVSKNAFWKKRINKSIARVEALYGELSEPFGIHVILEGGIKFDFQYTSKSEYTFDALIVLG